MKHSSDHILSFIPEPSVAPSCLQDKLLTSCHVQSLSCVQLFATPWTIARQAFLSFTIFCSLLKLMSTESVMPSNYLILCHPLLLLPSIFPSVRVFSNESALHIRWPKYWSLSISPPMNIQDWFPLRLTGLISLQSTGLSRVFSSTTIRKLSMSIKINFPDYLSTFIIIYYMLRRFM